MPSTPANSAKTVLVMDVNPLAGVVSGTQVLDEAATYRFNLSRGATPDADLSDATDRVYKVTVRPGQCPWPTSRSCISIATATLIATGKTGRTNDLGGAPASGPASVMTPSSSTWLATTSSRTPTYTDASGLTDTPGDDFFVGTNISSIVLEVPDSWIGAKANFWATTRRDGKRIDRMGKPGLNTQLPPTSERRQEIDLHRRVASARMP